ncbi:serine-rich adhesin for platelets-like [Diorhabda sublineata]|uniref:serine-rich adhesin for platelets-like n=1 Tax=Diorhabda sublineata TaxID=1163346 RepID=UPI0024E15E3F|nr:serine-rich adhesin for platelets-like [Diorhabda sublineata]
MHFWIIYLNIVVLAIKDTSAINALESKTYLRNEITTKSEGTTDEKTTVPETTTKSETTTDAETPTHSQATTDGDTTTKSERTTEEENTTQSQGTTDSETTTKSEITTEAETTTRSRGTTDGETTTPSEKTTDEETTTYSQVTTDAETTTKSEGTTDAKSTTKSEGTTNAETTTISEQTTDEESTTKSEGTTDAETTTKSEGTTDAETKTNSEGTTYVESTTKSEGTTNTETTTISEQTTDEESTTKSEGTTDAETTTKSEGTTDTESTTKSEETTNAETTTISEQTTDEESTTKSEGTTDAETTTKSEETTNAETTTNSQLTIDEETTTNSERTTDTDSTSTSPRTMTITTPKPYSLGTDNITWHPTSTENIIIHTEDGYKIAATIEECEIEEYGFANFTTGKIGEAVLIAYYVTQHPAVLYNHNLLYAHFNGSSSSNFTVVFTRIGEPITTTTTEATTTTQFLPTPSVTDSYELVVHLTGLDPFEYRHLDVLIAFKEMIASMACEYCQNNNIELIDAITTNNVKIIGILQCTNGWPTCNPCVEVRFALPINMKENIFWNGYQLNSTHLQIMWERYSQKYLGMGIASCEQENINNWIKWNIVWISCITGLILLFLLILRYAFNKMAKNAARSNREFSDQTRISANEEKTYDIELTQHYLQDMPKLFDNAYSMYNPDVGVSNFGFDDFEPVHIESIVSDDEDDAEVSCA